MLQEISNRLMFDIDEERETHDGDKRTIDTSFLQFSFQYLYDFDNEFRNDNQPSLIKDVSIDTYSEELEDYQEINDNTNVDINTSPQPSVRSSYSFIPSGEFRNNYQHNVVTTDECSVTELLDTDSKEAEDLELKIGLTFLNWAEFKIWIENFAKTKGFNYKIRTSQTDGEVIRRITYECSRSGIHNSQSSNIVRINLFDDNHNHGLTSNIQEIASRFQKLTSEMLCDIKKYVIQGRMDSGSIYPILKYNYPNQIIVKKDLYNAIYQFCLENNPGDSDVSQMLQMLLNWKDSDPL
ncbi:unnamed protein product [Rhizophagus irregularis]|uniref:FAR1 domain-containing protein n=1 Tax=Rhizophagus irregularis TaxID=588596 RepID=A0A2I1H6F2_9GLOM|nr:hypothetical protein RhiirA4_473281 [Rhizophagus irregularis]CAB4418150.1 unnamed protein product [Rhizophagus irregularis]